MFVKIHITDRLVRTLKYHELKIEKGVAECLAAENFVKDLDQLTRIDKLFHFKRLVSLNERTNDNTIHIPLVFNRDELLSNEKMTTIAKEYIHGIGLDKQPFLVYRHYDSTNPHMHILSVGIEKNGKRIDLFPDKFKLSEKIVNQIEIKYKLKPTSGYMDILNKRIISEQKEILKQKETIILKEAPEPKLKPMVTSETPNQKIAPTPLQAHSREQEQKPDPNSQRIITAIEWVLAGKTHDFNTLREDLAQERVGLEIRKEGMFYKDQISKTIFDGQALGRRYTLEGLRERGVKEQAQILDQKQEQKQTHRIRPSF